MILRTKHRIFWFLFYATKAIKAVKQCSDTDCHTNKQEWKNERSDKFWIWLYL